MNIFQALYCRVCFVKPHTLDGFVNAKIQIGYNFIVIDIDHKHKIINNFALVLFVGRFAFDKFGNERKYLLFRYLPPAL